MITQKVLCIDCRTSYYKIIHYNIEDFFGPVDLGLHLSGKYNSLNIGTGLLAGSILPGSNRLIFTGFSPCWGGFFISSMGGAALVFDNLGINMLSLIDKAPTTSILYLNRRGGEEIRVEVIPLHLENIWNEGRGGIYSLFDYTFATLNHRYETEPRILAVGPASQATDFGAVGSCPIVKGKLTHVDTWAGRGGFGSKLLQQHNIAAIIYGGTYIDEDFRDRKVADQWFEEKFNKKMSVMDIESTTKYRFEPNFQTGGTFGVNFASIEGHLLCFNYQSIYWGEPERLEIHKKFILDHYLKQFNEETIKPKQQKNCGEPCVAMCKKMNGEYKKDYEPYQTMGPLSGIFDQRAAEKLNHHADHYGFDAISAGGIISWLMECLSKNYVTSKDLGVTDPPLFTYHNFDIIADSMHNAEIGVEILDSIIKKRGLIDLKEGARKWARHLAREKGEKIVDAFVYTAYARNGWMVPNQYWTPGVLSPMAIMGKYYMYYGKEFIPPRELGRLDAQRMKKELLLDNMGMCRFHRAWAEEMLPEIMESLFGLKDKFLKTISAAASRINSRNSSLFWESERNYDFIYEFLRRKKDIEGIKNNDLDQWISFFEKDKREAALNFWYEMHKGIQESLVEF